MGLGSRRKQRDKDRWTSQDTSRGAEAADIGLITAVVPDGELDDVVAQMASRLLLGAKYAIKWTKASINAGQCVQSWFLLP
jgi:enoyl-CoA hydratase/carnithine racemase